MNSPSNPQPEIKTGLEDLTYQALASQDIFTLLGIAHISQPEKDQLMDKMMDTIKNRVTSRIADELTDDKAAEWQKLQTDEEKKKFLTDNQLDPDKMMLEEAILYKIELASLAQPAREAIKQKIGTKNA